MKDDLRRDVPADARHRRAMRDVGERGDDRLARRARRQVPFDVEEPQLAVIDERQRGTTRARELARQLRSNRSASARDDDSPRRERRALFGPDPGADRTSEQRFDFRWEKRDAHGPVRR